MVDDEVVGVAHRLQLQDFAREPMSLMNRGLVSMRLEQWSMRRERRLGSRG